MPSTSFRHRYRQTQVAHGILAIVFIALWATVDWSGAGWIAACVVFALAFLALEYRALKCPHCRGIVIRTISEDTGGVSLFGKPPAACRICGGNLTESDQRRGA